MSPPTTVSPDTLAARIPGLSADLAERLVGGDWRMDSRRVCPGDVFIALPGIRTHGLAHLAAARAAGAVAAISDRRPESAGDFPVLVLSDLSDRLAELLAVRYPVDWARVRVVAVTGTNGKTSVTSQLAQLAPSLELAAAVVGTVGYHGPGHAEAAVETTPHRLDIQRLTSTWQQVRPDLLLALEASSHALDQDRLMNLPVDVAVFTNLSRDHLDYHGTVDAYLAAKARLFAQPAGTFACAAVVPVDPPELAAAARRAGRSVCTVGAAGSGADVCWASLKAGVEGTRWTLSGAFGSLEAGFPALGAFQAVNASMAVAAAAFLGLPAAEGVRALADWRAAPGRLQRVLEQPCALVDYAHTPDALARTLESLREILEPGGRIQLVFGAGGDRDAGKRPAMGAVAERLADRVIVTADNPRSEDPAAIAAAILAGMQDPAAAEVELDRRQAIRCALETADKQDVVLVAGKGHETEQIVGTERIPFDDREEILQWAGPC